MLRLVADRRLFGFYSFKAVCPVGSGPRKKDDGLARFQMDTSPLNYLGKALSADRPAMPNKRGIFLQTVVRRNARLR